MRALGWLAWLLLLGDPARAASGLAREPFVDRTAAWGLDFVHFDGKTGALYFPEMAGPGVALVDYDGDGDLDLYLVQGQMLGEGEVVADALTPPRGPLGDRLYRNDQLAAGTAATPRFLDVTARAALPRLPAAGYGMGVATGDVDRDGDVDLYVTAYGSNRLLRNGGDGTFVDVTSIAGVDDPRWSTSATFADLDEDGALDLFVANYVEFSVAANPACYAPTSRRDYCGPRDFRAQGDGVFRNRGDGTFEETAARWLGTHEPGPGLGAVSEDFDDDGNTDLLVANDGAPNHLWLERPGTTFAESGLLSGLALDRWGRPQASMGVAVNDADGDGDLDVLMTHLTGESNTYYENAGGGVFSDRSAASGLGPPSLPWTGFGAVWIDADGDGDLDLAVTNGAVLRQEERLQAGDPDPLRQPDQLFENLGQGRFQEAPGGLLGPGAPVETGRGLAAGDLDGDGDLDLVLTNNGGPARLLETPGVPGQRWLGVDVRHPSGSPAVGARVLLETADGESTMRRIAADGSYLSAGDPRAHFSLGDRSPTAVVIVHPGDVRQVLTRPPSGRWLVVGGRR